MTLSLLTQAQLGCDNVQWFHHALERVNYWQRKADTGPSTEGNRAMVALWERERVIAWGKLSPRERKLVSNGSAA